MSINPTSKTKKAEGKRDFLIISTYAMAGIGAASVAWPLIDQMNPRRRHIGFSFNGSRSILS